MKRRVFLTTCMVVSVTSPVVAQGFTGFFREARIGLIAMNLSRSSALQGDPLLATGNGTLSGVDGLLRLDIMGVRARQLSGTVSSTGQGLAGSFTERELSLVVGPRVFALEGGALDRTTYRGTNPVRATFPKAGLRSQWNVGGRLVQVTVAAAVVFDKLQTSLEQMSSVGHDAEASLVIQPHLRMPVYFSAGYRYEAFRDPQPLTHRVEELNSIYLGIGLRLARNVSN